VGTGGTITVSGSGVNNANQYKGNSLVASADLAVVSRRRTCSLTVGADNGAVLVDADLGPQNKQCFIPAAATIVEVTVAADGGTPNVIPRKTTPANSHTNLLSSALATAATGGTACANTGGTTGLDGTTTCSSTLSSTALAAGEYIGLTSGTAGGTAKRMSVFITYTVD
jgi:hypothetical protein